MCSPHLLLLFATAAFAQQEPPPGVTGTVTNALTREPIARAHIALRPPGDKPERKYGAISAPDGKFSIVPMPPGEYVVSVEHAGFVAAPDENGIAYISVAVKEHGPIELKLKLLPQGVIAGRILDANGDPVEAIRVETARGRSLASATTNARGEYRLSGLRPGRYLIRATPPEGGPPEIRTDGSQEKNYGITWYPGVPGEDAASAVAAAAGVETAGIDIHLSPAPILRISATVTNIPAGAKDYVLIREFGAGFRQGYTTSMLTTGRLTLWRLTPGKYRLSARCEVPGGRVWTPTVELELVNQNIDNVELRFVPPFAVKGAIQGDIPPPKEDQPRKRTILLQQIGSRGWKSDATEIAADGTFQIAKVHPDRYRVVLAGMPPGTYVKSIHLGDVETIDATLDLGRGAPAASLEVTAAIATGRLSGTVQGPNGPIAGVRVAVVPDGADGIYRLRTVAVDSGGKYVFDFLPPGTYQVFAFDPTDLENLKEGIGIEWYEKTIEKVDVKDGSEVKDLRFAAAN